MTWAALRAALAWRGGDRTGEVGGRRAWPGGPGSRGPCGRVDCRADGRSPSIDELGPHPQSIGVDVDPLQARRANGAGIQTDPNGLRQQPLHAVRPDALTVANQRGRIAGRLVLEKLEAAEMLPVRVLDPELEQALVADIECMLEIAEADHQPRRQGRSPGAPAEPPEGFLETRPVDQRAELHELVSGIDDVVELASEQIVDTGQGRAFRRHRKSQGLEGFRHVSRNLR